MTTNAKEDDRIGTHGNGTLDIQNRSYRCQVITKGLLHVQRTRNHSSGLLALMFNRTVFKRPQT
jgi:hypothetical protein